MNAARDFDPNYETILTPQEETQFTEWKQKNAPKDSGADYDLRGAFLEGLTPDPATGHWSDKYKKPNHPTFSNESQYAEYGAPGHWDKSDYVPPSPGGKKIAQLREGGFSDQEITDWSAKTRRQLSEGGFSQGVIDTYFGQPPFDPKPLQQHIETQIQQAIAPDTPDGPPKNLKSFAEAFEAGFGMSSASLLVKPPTVELGPDPSRSQRIASQLGTMLGDVPLMGAGYLIGGRNPLLSMGATFALAPAVRRIMMDAYEHGAVTSWADFWDRASGATIDMMKAYITGVATSAVGKAIGLTPIASPTLKNVATVGGEISTMVAVGSALDGHMPEPDEFIDAAIALGFVKGTTRIAQKIRDVYTHSAVRPRDMAADIQRDVTIMQDLASDNVVVPKTYQEAMGTTAAPTVDALHTLAESKGYQWDNNPAFMDLTESVTGKRHLDDLTPVERKQLGEVIASSAPTPAAPSHPERYLLALRGDFPIPAAPKAGPLMLPAPVAPLDRFELAQTPRHQTHIDQNAEMLARAEKGMQDLETAGMEQEGAGSVMQFLKGRGGVQDQGGELSNMGVDAELKPFVKKLIKPGGMTLDEAAEAAEEAGLIESRDIGLLLSAIDKEMRGGGVGTGWYAEATTGTGKLSRERVEVAINKIIENKGRDKGKDVQRIKELLLGDQEFEQSEFAPKNEEEWQRARQYAMTEWEPDVAMAGGAPPRPPKPPKNKPVTDAQKKVLERVVRQEPETEGMTYQDIRTSIIDNLNPIKQALRRGGKQELATAEDPYKLERLTRGNMGKGQEFIKHGAFDFETYETITRGYDEIIKPVTDDQDAFVAYEVSKRAIEKAEQGIPTGIPLDEAKEVVREGKEKYEKVHREVVEYRNALVKYMRKGGLLSEKDEAAMLEANKDYVPFYRFMEEETADRWKKAKGGGGSPIKRMKGGEQQILDPIVSDIKNTFLYIALAEKNAAKQAYVALGEDFAVKQKQPVKPIQLKEAEIRKVFDEFLKVTKQTKRTQAEQTKTTTTGGVEGQEPPGKALQLVTERVKEALKARGFSVGETDQMVTRIAAGGKGADHTTIETVIREVERTTYVPELDIRLPNEAATIWRAFRAPLAKDEIAVFTDGKREVYKVDPKVAEAFEDQDNVSSNLLARMLLHAPASLLRAGVTITPDFIMRNIVRDALSAFIFAGSHPIRTAQGFKSIVSKDTAFHNWMKGGGANATMVAIDRDYIQQNLVDLNTKTGLMQRMWNVAKTPLDLLRATSELVENSTRLGAVRPEMMKAKDKAAIQALSLLAREATVDFSVHGRDMQEFSKMTAFFNPALQGIDRMGRAFKEYPVATTAKALASITLPSILLWYANKDDKEIQDLPRWQKDLFWLVRIPLPKSAGFGDSFIARIPKPFEIGIVFGTLPERLLDAFFTDNPNAFRDFEESMSQAFLPSLIPTTLVPIIGQFANRSTFTGGPIVPLRTEGLLPEYQYTPYTTETAKAIGQIIGAFPGMENGAISSRVPYIGGVAHALTSPALIENYVRSWTGGMGMYLLQLADKGLREAGVVPDPVKPAWAVADIPFVKAFVVRYPSASAQSVQDFYQDYATSKVYYDTMMHLAKEGDKRSLQLIRTHTADLAQLSGIHNTVGNLAELIQKVDKNPKITPYEKRQLIDTLYYDMIQVSKSGNRMLRFLDEKMHPQKLQTEIRVLEGQTK